MPSARELLEQADALMRRNRAGVIDTEIPELREVISMVALAPAPRRGAASRPRRRARAHRGGRGDRDRVDRRVAGGHRRVVRLAAPRSRRIESRDDRTGFHDRRGPEGSESAVAPRCAELHVPRSRSSRTPRRRAPEPGRSASACAGRGAVDRARRVGRPGRRRRRVRRGRCRTGRRGGARRPPRRKPAAADDGRAGRCSPTRSGCRCCSGSTSSPKRGCATN